MALVVQKFGGSSVANAERIRAAACRAMRARQAGNQVIVVVSARGDTTDELIKLAREITDNPPEREMDMLLATGEQISIALLAMALQSLGQPAISFTGAQIGIVTDSFHTKARIKNISTQRMRQALDDGQIVIVAGFQGIDENYNITTLGRGGSDTTAVALAAVLKHDSTLGNQDVGCEIYTDVDGVYTTDPRLVPEARKIDFISYDEMLELASLGAGVMHSRSIEFAKKFDVPLQVRSSFTDVEGTWIVPESEWMNEVVVCGCAIVKDEARIWVEGIPDDPSASYRLFNALADKNIVLDMIAQSIGSDGRRELGFTLPSSELPSALALVRPLATELGLNLQFEEGVSKVSIVGTGMRTHTGVAEKMFNALADEGVNIKMITTGDIKISVLVDKSDGVRALRAVHHCFGLFLPRPGSGGDWAGPTGGEIYRPRPPISMDETKRRDLVSVTQQLTSMEEIVVSDVLIDDEQGRVTIFDLPDKAGNCLRVFKAVAAGGIVVDLIVQNLTRPGFAELTFSVPRGDLDHAARLTEAIARVIDPATRVGAEAEIAKIIVLGVGMRTHTGVVRRMFSVLSEQGIPIRMINTSEVRVSVVVDRRHGSAALDSLRSTFRINA